MDLSNSTNNTDVSDAVTSTSGMTVNFIVLCQLFTLLKQWVSEESLGPNVTTIKPDTDINSDSDTAFIFSTADCGIYNRLTGDGYGQCATEVGPHNYDRNLYEMLQFTDCSWFFFMTKLGATEKCSNISLGDDNTNDVNALTLLSKDRIFYSFMTESLGLEDVCDKNTTVCDVTDVTKGISNKEICDSSSSLKSPYAENKCRPTSEKDASDDAGITHCRCAWFRFLTELGAKYMSKQASCKMYTFVMTGIIGGVLSITGILCNIGSLIVFRHGMIKTPTIYQLQWLALVDTIFLVLCFVCVNLFCIIKYLHIDNDDLWQVMVPYIVVYIWPLFVVAETSTNWLTLFIGVYRHLATCMPASNLYCHVERHRRKYVRIVLIMATLCNIPYFFEHRLSQDNKNNYGYALTSLGESALFKFVYHNIMYRSLTVCLPVIILLIVTAKMIVVLRKKENIMSDLKINTVFITIVLTSTISQLPLLVYSILNAISASSSIGTLECGSFLFYFSRLESVFLVLNSAARPFIYMVLNNLFVWRLRRTLRNERAESIEIGSM